MSMTVRFTNATTVLLITSIVTARFMARKFPVAGATISLGAFTAAGITSVAALIASFKEF